AGNANPDDYPITFALAASVFQTLPDNTWLRLPTVPTPRYYCVYWTDCSQAELVSSPVGRAYVGTTYADGKIYYFGGGHFSHAGNDVEVFDIGSQTWVQQYPPEPIPDACLSDPYADPSCIVMQGGHG